jgi:hypothetical protein
VTVPSFEEEIIQRVRELEIEQQKRVREFIRGLATQPEKSSSAIYSARELLKLPLDERNRIIAAAIDRVADDDIELFEAFT